MNELHNRGVEDILIAVVDGLKGFPEAILAVFPQATVQTCIVHLLRQSLEFVSYKDRKPIATALKDIYRAVDATTAEAALTAFEAGEWGRKSRPSARAGAAPGAKWCRSMHSRRSTAHSLHHERHRGAECQAPPRDPRQGLFPDRRGRVEAAVSGLAPGGEEWTMAPREWCMAKAQFAVLFGERFTKAMA